MGFFDKIVRSDIFVILDSVQFPKTGGFWANRVKVIIGGEPKWITMPIIRAYSGTRLISEIEIDHSGNWNGKILRTIEVNYKKADHFPEIFPLIEKLLNNKETNLSRFNLVIINSLCSLLGIDTSKFMLSSALKTKGNATELLISILRLIKADAYMCGGGAQKYQEDVLFSKNNIELIYQSFSHPVYRQFNSAEFVPGLSIIDALLNCGVKATRNLLNLQN